MAPDLTAAEEVGAGPGGATAVGSLLAVCALCGGAGASTLTYLVGLASAEAEDRPVLACDAGEPTAGLSAYAGVESLHSFAELANCLSAGRPVADGLYAEAATGLRLIAAAPRLHEEVELAAAADLLADARAGHALTVVDCGRLATVLGRFALERATHVAWILPATVSGIVRARRLLPLVEPEPGRRELMVARFDAGGRQPPIEELTALAETRDAPLVLMPHVPDLGEHDTREALDAAQVTLEAIRSLLRR
jgi:MinD-like ATPase involved in chromosome partitioning or flagellar assembly